jgi:hypothetical protein
LTTIQGSKRSQKRKRKTQMTPTRIDVSIICTQCHKPVEKREMFYDVPAGVYRYYVQCHGAKDFGDHLTVTAADAHGKVLQAFPTEGGASPEPSA